MPRPRQLRGDYAHFQTMTTRWRDMDVYGHMNNVVFYEYVDTAVNEWLIAHAGLDLPDGDCIGLVVETACVFHASLELRDRLTTGLRVTRIGNSSVQYEVGLFRNEEDEASAEARFVHVYVDGESRRPTPLPECLRTALETIQSPRLRSP